MTVSEKSILTFTIDFETAKRYREANKMPHQFRRAAWTLSLIHISFDHLASTENGFILIAPDLLKDLLRHQLQLPLRDRNGITTEPVSYTHLDVYKRQPVHAADP